jgi:hypothetical protein
MALPVHKDIAYDNIQASNEKTYTSLKSLGRKGDSYTSLNNEASNKSSLITYNIHSHIIIMRRIPVITGKLDTFTYPTGRFKPWLAYLRLKRWTHKGHGNSLDVV